MHRFIANLTTTTLLTAGLGVTVVASVQADTGHHHGQEHSPTEEMQHEGGHGGHHGHGMLEISDGQPVPLLVVDVFPDRVSGWNLQVQIENWEFAPERVNENSVATEGHAHLYLNGEKLTRLYSEWYYIPSLPPGEHVLTVGLNANRHEALMHNGEPIEASVKVTVPETASAM